MASLIWSAVTPGASVLKMVVRLGIPPGTPALDQSAALSGLRMPRQFWAGRDWGWPREAIHIAAAGRLHIPLFIGQFIARGFSWVEERLNAARWLRPSGPGAAPQLTAPSVPGCRRSTPGEAR